MQNLIFATWFIAEKVYGPQRGSVRAGPGGQAVSGPRPLPYKQGFANAWLGLRQLSKPQSKEMGGQTVEVWGAGQQHGALMEIPWSKEKSDRPSTGFGAKWDIPGCRRPRVRVGGGTPRKKGL